MTKPTIDQPTRRGALAVMGGGMAAAAGAPVLGIAGAHNAMAATEPAPKQNAGFYRHKIGDIVVTQITDGARTFPLPDGFVKNASREQVNAALGEAFMPPDTMTIVFNPILVDTGGKRVLLDTGNGPDPKGAVGQLLPNMAAAGVDPKSVDMVVITHFHGDHVNGLRLADGSLAFPNAEIKVPEAEWKFWMDDANMERAQGGVKNNFVNARRVFKDLGDRVSRYAWDKEVAAGLTPFATTGHTPGHTSLSLQSGKDRLLVQADVTNHPALFVTHPGWHAIFDMDADKAEATRRALYDRAAADKVMIAGFHYPFPALGHIEKAGTGYRMVPVAWKPTL